jgi:O-antigen ligase
MFRTKLSDYIEITIILITILVASVLAGNTDFMQMFGRVAIFGLSGLFVILAGNLKENARVIQKNPATGFFLAILIIALFQSAEWTHLSIYPSFSFNSLITLLSCFLLFAMSTLVFKERVSLLRFYIAFMIFGFLESAIGLSQAFSGRNELFGLVFPRGWRANGTFYNPDHFSAFLELCFFMSLGFVVSILPSKERFLRWRDRIYALSGKERNILLLILFCSGIILLGIIYTKSRMGIFATFAGLVFFVLAFIQSRKKSPALRRSTYLVAVMLVVSFYLGLDTIVERYKKAGVDLDTEYGSRGSLWRTSISAILDKPFTGSGVGTYRFAYPRYQPAHLQGYYTHAHNDYVEAGVETGLSGLLVILTGGFLYFRQVLNRWKTRHNPWAKGLSIGALSGILSVAIHSAGDFVLRSYANGILFSIMLAITFNAVNMERYEN